MKDAFKKEILNEENINSLRKILSDIKFGSVTLIIQDGVLIQIEKNEKVRLK